MAGEKKQYVVVTTTHRGVFAGYLTRLGEREVVLEEARVCVHWSAVTRGFVGLAVTGPGDGSRVSSAAPSMTVLDVTALIQCTDEARARWESGPWS
jgi:hypothetical protein